MIDTIHYQLILNEKRIKLGMIRFMLIYINKQLRLKTNFSLKDPPKDETIFNSNQTRFQLKTHQLKTLSFILKYLQKAKQTKNERVQ